MPALDESPMPDSVTRAVPPLLLVRFNVALLLPPDVGENETDAVVEAPDASVAVAGDPTEKFAASAPVTVNGGVRVIEKLLVFVIVTGDDAVPPTCAVPRFSGFGVPLIVAVPIPTV